MSDSIYIYPTDTVWGIGCHYASVLGRKMVADIKGTSVNKPLTLLFSDGEMLRDYFNLPDVMTIEWLTHFFSLETSLALSSDYFKKDSDLKFFEGREYICFRLVSNESTREIISLEQAPITTTSLNLSGRAPIVNPEIARGFSSQLSTPVNFFYYGEQLSGNSSTMIQYDGGGYGVWRQGGRWSEVEKFLRL